MNKPILTDKDKAYIKENRLKISAKSIAKHIGCSPGTVQRYLRKEGLQPPRELIKKFRVQKMIGRTTLTPKQDEFIKANYLDIPIKQLAKKIGKSQTAVRGRIRQIGLTIPVELALQRKRKSQFKKGQTPNNKGKKQTDYMSTDAINKSKATRFKKGNIPHNTCDRDGVIRIRQMDAKEGKKGYKWIRIALGKWKMLHVYNWEKENGLIPKNMIVVFKNGDTMNCDISNLEMISREEHARRNVRKYHSYPEDLKKAIKANNRLTQILKENEK